ncbi:MAG: GNAT family N-acetyltransferase [Gammaproteobacteria bacterium]
MLRAADFVFRPFVPDDAPGFVDAVLESTPALSQWMPWAHEQYAMADALGWIDWCQQGWTERGTFEFGIFDAASNTFVGGCGLNQFNTLHGYCNLGYWVRQSYQRRGAATAAIGALSRFAFAELGLGRVEIVVALGNAASLGVARKAGAIEEGIARNRLKFGDRFMDAHVLSLVRPMVGLANPPSDAPY